MGENELTHWIATDQRQATLHEAFVALWARCCGPREIGNALANRLIAAYAEKHRRYHSLAHIEHCLEEFARVHSFVMNPERIEMAIWFHDAVYAHGAADNEALSAELFVHCCAHHLSPDLVDDVGRLIRITTHRQPPGPEDECYIVDIELSSFALPRDRFERDSKHVREEHPGLREEDYRVAHGRFLRALLARPRIFTTDFFHRRCEQEARRNIARWLDFLCTTG